MVAHLRAAPDGLGPGLSHLLDLADPANDLGIGLAVLHLRPGEVWRGALETESAWLLMGGRVRARTHARTDANGTGAREVELSRRSLFDEGPSCLHLAPGAGVVFEALEATELTLHQVPSSANFPPEVYRPELVREERRGRGAAKDAALRVVRTIFDATNTHPTSQMVLGEVLTLPGRWSSYPPHHHPQPEVYHYRFTHPAGYGHAELGDEVLKVRHGDTVSIRAGQDHAQCAAPGYGMYYAWTIRHLEGARYDVPEFTEAHRWLLEPGAPHWWPSDVD